MRHIQASGSHLLSLINELLDFSRAEHGRLEIVDEKVDLAALLQDCVELLTLRAEHSGISLESAVQPPLPRLLADPRRLRQVMLNVLSNAIKFTPSGGRIEISTERRTPGELVVSVRDTGIGMAEDEIPVAMEYFGQADSSHSRTTEGTGIGLPFTALLMQLHGGAIHIDSAPGQGTLVTLHFPASRVIDGPGPRLGVEAERSPERESA